MHAASSPSGRCRAHPASGPGRRSAVLLAVLLMPLPGARTADLPWRWSNPLPHGNNVYDMVFRDGEYWQVGDRGQVHLSNDRILWEVVPSGTTRSLRGIAATTGGVVISGQEGLILVGSRAAGLTPATVTPATADWLESVAAGSGVLVAVGDNAAIYQSTNGGTNWTRVTGLPFSDWLRSVAYGGGTFVAVGENGLIATSANGSTWRKRTSGVTTALNRVTAWNGVFMVVGDSGVLLTSLNLGANWSREQTGTTNSLYACAQTGVTRLVAGESALRVKPSPTGSWEDHLGAGSVLPAPVWDYFASVWDGSRFCVAGRTGLMVESTTATNVTGLLWFEETDSPRDWLWDALGLPGQYLAVGDYGRVMSSDNGVDWYTETVPDSLTNAVFLGIGGSTNLVLAAGSDGSLMSSTAATTNLVTTNNVIDFTGCAWVTNTVVVTNTVDLLGFRWTAVSPPPTTNTLQSVAHRDGLYVVAGDAGTVLTTTNAATWTLRNLAGRPNLSSVAAGPGTFVATGQGGVILSSPDALEWTPRASGTTNWVYRVRAVNGGFVAVGQNGTILTSPDGVTWTPRPSGTTAWLTDAAHAGGRYYVSGTQGTVLTSPDLDVWTALPVITSKSLYALAARHGQLVALGIEGVILRTPLDPLAPVEITRYATDPCPATRVDRFAFRGQVDQRFAVDASPDLESWAPIGEVVLEFGTQDALFVRTNLPPAPTEFFRARMLDP